MRCPERIGAAATPGGFATATVLGLVAVVALLSTGALHDALFGEQLAMSRLLHQRAAALADFGVRDAMQRLSSLGMPGSQSYALQPLPPATDSVSVELRHVQAAALPQGSSAGRVELHHFEIRSTGHAARGIHMTEVQGAVRAWPAAPLTAPEPGP